MKFSLASVALIVSFTSFSQAAVSLDGSYGNGVECPAGSCCSTWGFCGTGPAFCGAGNGGGSSGDNGVNGSGNNDNNGINGGGNANGNGGGNANGNGTDDEQAPVNSQPNPAPTQADDSTNAGTTPGQPMVASPTPTNNNDHNNTPTSGETVFNPITLFSVIVITVAGYFNN